MAPRDNPVWITVLAIVGGAALGLALGAGFYTALAAVLEEAGGPLVDLQGFAWNLVPLGTLAGGALGWWAAVRWQRRGRGS